MPPVGEVTGGIPGTMFFDRPLELVPRNELQDRMEDAILLPDNIEFLDSGAVVRRLKLSRFNVV
jgi:hypothetical protein